MSWQLPWGWSGTPIINVWSHSIPVRELEELADCLRLKLMCRVLPPQAISGLETCCPQLEKLKSSSSYFSEEHTQFVASTRPYIEVAAPSHLGYLQHGVLGDHALLAGSWIVEQKIERNQPNSEWFRLPKKLELAQSFISDPPDTKSRIVEGGLLAHTATNGHRKIILKLQENDEIFTTILHGMPHISIVDRRANMRKKPVCLRSLASDKGQYLIGAIGRFGGLAEAFQFVESRFWRSVFMYLASKRE